MAACSFVCVRVCDCVGLKGVRFCYGVNGVGRHSSFLVVLSAALLN